MRKILRAGEVDAAPRAVGHKALAVLRSEDDAFDKVRHGDERDAPVAVPVHDVDTGSSDGVEYFVHPAVACTEHGARTNNRDGQRAGVPRGRLLARVFAPPIVRDRQRRIAFHFRRLARGPRGGERRNEQEHRALRLLGARRRDRLDALGVHAHEVSGRHRPHEPREVEYDTGVRQRDGPRDARAIIDIAGDELSARGKQLLDRRRRAHQAGYRAAARDQQAYEMQPDKATGAGDQNRLLIRSIHAREAGRALSQVERQSVRDD